MAKNNCYGSARQVHPRQRQLLAGLILASAAYAADPTVAITGGQIQGRSLSSAGAVFKGVPFAAPPLDDLRWREPQPVKPWKGVRDAASPGAPCAQPAEGWNDKSAAISSEDCLYLNLWTPEWPVQKLRPVMVWIHGGANRAGSGSTFDGAPLSSHGVVLVSINYRLGFFGFLAHPALTAESPHHASGSYGTLDQIAALQWVKENIAKFGGDPANVTLFGQSAGAQDIGLLMTSPLAAGLFQRAIAESGSVFIRAQLAPSLRDAERNGVKLAEALKAPTLEALRKASAADILAAATALKSTPAGPNVEGWVFPEQPASVFVKGTEQRIPLIIGNNARETPAHMDAAALKHQLERTYQDLAPRAIELYGVGEKPPTGERSPDPYPPYGDAASQFATDFSFRCSGAVIAQLHSAAGNPVYQYEFSDAPLDHGATHSSEVPFVFGTMRPRPTSAAMQAYWTNFAKTGDPNGEGLDKWREYSASGHPYMEFASEGMLLKQALRAPFCEVFRAHVERQIAQWGERVTR
jgi:para-nitrobenzyl esterase